jgi:predicted MFS family arabinose efflux permease
MRERGMSDDKALTKAEFRLHWKLVMAAAIGFAFASVTSSSTGPLMEPLGKEFGWSRALQSSGPSITAILTFFMSPVFGLLIDRWGTRRMALAGIAFAGLMIAAFSQVNGSPTQWIVLWLFYAFAAVMIKSTVWTAAVSSVFTQGRGLALGLTLSGTALANAIVPPITNALIDAYGWRGAFVGLGLGGGTIALVVCWLFLFDGYAAAQREGAKRPDQSKQLLDAPGLSMPEAWRSHALWKIGLSTLIMMVITIALNVHQFEILRSAGVTRTSAAWYASVAGITGIAGKLVTGWLLDRYHAKWVGSLTLASTAIAFGILLMPGLTPAMIVTAMAINGYSAGTKLQLASFLTSAYGGMRNFGGIFGVIASLIAAGSGIGPVLGGYVFDRFGNYDPFLWFGIAGSLLCGLLIYTVGPYPVWAKKD